jgi:aspartyl-tRNA(Asn)/glutamyl-tRNA(Gln) amidotransferase subunit C
MAKIDENLISRLEILARIKIDDDSKAQMQQDLNKIVNMFDKLAEIDTTDVTPLRHMSHAINVRREDIIKHQLDNNAALKNAKLTHEGFFAVPKFLKPKSTK